MKKERKHAKTEEGREKLSVKGGFTSTASRSRTSEVEAGSPSFEVEEKKGDLPSSRNQCLEELAALEKERWIPPSPSLTPSPWLITTGMPSVRRCIKASKEKTGEKCMWLTKK